VSLDAISRSGLSANAVQVVWLKMGSQLGQLVGSQANRVEQERAWLEDVLANAKNVFPNLRQVYASSRIYVGYEESPNHAEPFTGYDNGLSVRAIVADSVNSSTAVWTAWGPYLWADGTTPRNDGLTWECGDYESDGVHPSIAGEQKVANELFSFFSTEPAACAWFLADPSDCATVGIGEPIAANDGPYLALFGGSLTIGGPGVLGNDWDPDGGGLTAVIASSPTHGTLALQPNGSFTYAHDGTAASTDSFTYQAKDAGGELSNTATVSLEITSGVSHLPGLVDAGSGEWFLYDGSGGLDTSFYFGNPGDVPFMGDWDGDGVETPGLYRQSDGFVYLRNSNSQGIADVSFFFGNPGDVPIAGDFDGDGFDSVSIYRPSNQTFYIINELGENNGGLGAADVSYVFGNPGDKPFVGDFDGDGVETVGLHRESTGLVYYRNVHTQGNAQNQFFFGDPGDRLIAGDWTDDGIFTPGLFRPSTRTFFFKYTNSQGNADNQFIPVPNNTTWLPISGNRP
jgi:hypothetical protein